MLFKILLFNSMLVLYLLTCWWSCDTRQSENSAYQSLGISTGDDALLPFSSLVNCMSTLQYEGLVLQCRCFFKPSMSLKMWKLWFSCQMNPYFKTDCDNIWDEIVVAPLSLSCRTVIIHTSCMCKAVKKKRQHLTWRRSEYDQNVVLCD